MISSRRQWVFYLIRVAITLLIVAGMVVLVGGVDLGAAISVIGVGAYLGSLALNVSGSILVPALVTERSQPPDQQRMGLRILVSINFAIRFYTIVLPRFVATGIRWWRYRAQSGGSEALALVVLEKLLQVFTYASLAVVALTVERQVVGDPFVFLALGLLLLVGISGLGLSAFFLVPPRNGALNALKWTGDHLGEKASKWSRDLADSIVAMGRARLQQAARLIAWMTLSYVFFVASALVVTWRMGIDISVSGMGWMRASVFLVTLIPFTIAGIGVREAGYVLFLGIYGIDSQTALTFALVLLSIQVAIGAVGGVIEFVRSTNMRAAQASSVDEPQ